MTLSLEMLQTAEMVLDISPYDLLSADDILGQIARYIRKKRSVALDRVEFEEYRQDHGATFDEFYIGLQRIAKCADLCRHCLDQRMTTRVMSGICDQDVRKNCSLSHRSHRYRPQLTYAAVKKRPAKTNLC